MLLRIRKMKRILDSKVNVFLLLIVCLLVLTSCRKTPAKAEKSKEAAKPAAAVQKAESNSVQKTPAPSATAIEPNAAGLVPLDIKLPTPMFIGTPQNLAVPNLEKPLGKPRPAFLAPEGTTNVALKKPVASTDKEPIIGELKMVTDGDKEAADGSYVELGPMVQSVTIDLGGEYDIYAVIVWHYHKQARVYFDVVVQASDDPNFARDVKTIFNNDIDNTSGLGAGRDMNYVETSEGKLIDAKGVRGRYVRLYSSGNNSNELNHYIEVEVYGKAAK